MKNSAPRPSRNTLEYVERALRSHKNVTEFFERPDGSYCVEREKGRPIIVLFTDIYTIGMADVIEAMNAASDLNCIVTTSAWNSYTADAKRYGKENEVGVFKLPEFMGALWYDKLWNYVKRERD